MGARTTLRWRRPDGRLAVVELSPCQAPLVIGRAAPGPLCVEDDKLSRQHAQLDCVRGLWQLTDLASRNGVYLLRDGGPERRERRIGLVHLDRVRMGDTVMVFRVEGTAGAGAGAGEPRTADSAHRVVALTARQREVLDALCAPRAAGAVAATNEEIARALHLSLDGVRAHLKEIYRRYGLLSLPTHQRRQRLLALALADGYGEVGQRDSAR